MNKVDFNTVLQSICQFKQVRIAIARTLFVLYSILSRFNYIAQISIIFALICRIALQLLLLFVYFAFFFSNLIFSVIRNLSYLRDLIQNYISIRYNIDIYTEECNQYKILY